MTNIKMGKVVWVYKTGYEGEIVKTVMVGDITKYHVRIPTQGETFIYAAEDLFVFGPVAEENIRKEWARTAL